MSIGIHFSVQKWDFRFCCFLFLFSSYFLPKLFKSLFELFTISFIIVIKSYKAFQTFLNVLFKKLI